MGDFVNNPVPTIQEEVITLKLENEQLKCDLYNTESNLQSMTINCENLEKENENNKLALNEGKEIIADLEGQNKILTNRILELQKTCGALTDKVEEMKNAGNCKHFMECTKINEKEFVLGKIVTCKGCKKWEIAE